MSGRSCLKRRLGRISLPAFTLTALCAVGSVAHAAGIRNAGPSPAKGDGLSITALPDGRILAYGDNGASVWSPERRNWENVQPYVGLSSRYYHSATIASDGRVVVAGGAWTLDKRAQEPRVLSTTATWYPQSGKWEKGVSLLAARFAHTATPLPGGDVLLIGGSSRSEGIQPRAPFLLAAERVSANSSRQVKSASVARANHTATLLPDGRVLVVGGVNEEGNPLADVEIYDFAKDAWTTAAPLHVPRTDHTATLLRGGSVLVIGGRTVTGAATASAEIWNPGTGEWSDAPSLAQPRSRHATTLLKDGSLLVAGGRDLNEQGALSVELLAPRADRWQMSATLPAAMPEPRTLLLANGNVILFGRTLSTRSTYSPNDSDAGPFVWLPHGESGTRFVQRIRYRTTLLPDGRILVTGGDVDRVYSRAAQIYDPATGGWENIESMQLGRTGHDAFVLPDGRVVVGGGWVTDPATGQNSSDSNNPDREAVPSEIWDPRTGHWTLSASYSRNTFWTELGSLPDGRLFSQYLYDMPREPYLAWMHRWRPTDVDIGAAQRIERPRQGGAAAVLPSGRILFAGGEDAGARSDVWEPATGAWRSLRPFEGLPHTALRLFSLGDGRVIAVGAKGIERQEALPIWTESTSAWSTLPLPEGIDASQIQQATGLSGERILLLLADSSLLWNPLAQQWDTIRYDTDWSAGANIVSLPNGRVLAFREPARGQDRATSVVELGFAAKIWRPDLSHYIPRSNPAVVPLKNGTALVAGGDSAVAQLWKVSDDSWSATGFLHSPLLHAQGLALADGRAMVLGWTPVQDKIQCELWSPATGAFTSCGSLPVQGHRSTAFWLEPLAAQRVLVLFGQSAAIWDERRGWESVAVKWPGSVQQPYGTGKVSFLEPIASVFDPSSNGWRDATEAYFRRNGRPSMTLADGSVVSLHSTDDAGFRWIPGTRQLERMEFRGWAGRAPSHLVQVDGRCGAAWSDFAGSTGNTAARQGAASGIRLLDVDAKQWSTTDAVSIELTNAGYAVTADGTLLMAGTNRFEAAGRGTRRFRLTCQQAIPLDADGSLYLPVTFAIERKPPAPATLPSSARAKPDLFEQSATWLRHQRIKLYEWNNRQRLPLGLVLLVLLLFLSPIIRYIVRKRF